MNNNNNKKNGLLGVLITGMLIFGLFFVLNLQSNAALTTAELNTILTTEKVTEITLSPKSTTIEITGSYEKDGMRHTFTSRVPNSEFEQEKLDGLIKDSGAEVTTIDPYAQNSFVTILADILPTLLLLGAMVFLFRMMNSNSSGNKQAFDFSKSRAKTQTNIKVRFDDVAGADEEKKEMEEIIEYLKYPKKFEEMGARVPKGMLLQGPPGTGKTLLAKAAAGEADVPFYSISGSDFVEMFVGVGASRVRNMFKKAKETAPCIIFIDEIDAVGRQRGAGVGGGNDEREQTLNQLLVEMDGMDENSGIVILAATNRSDVLDPALLRPGRFDRTITVGLPDVKGRTEILKVHSRNKRLENDVDLESIAKRTPSFSGADLENVMNEAAILAVRENKKSVSMDVIDEAIDRVMMGPAKVSKKYIERERRMVAIHETGHAIIGLKLDSADKVQKVTIIPRGNAGGYNLMTPKEETFTQSKSDLIGRITGYLGGRVAEEIVLGEISTGAYSDIDSATRIARAMVMSYGMSELGPIQYEDRSGNVFLGRDYSNSQNYSGEIAFEIDKEVRRIIDEAYENARTIISENMDLLNNIVDALLEHETITADQIENIMSGKDINAPIEEVIDVQVTTEEIE